MKFFFFETGTRIITYMLIKNIWYVVKVYLTYHLTTIKIKIKFILDTATHASRHLKFVSHRALSSFGVQSAKKRIFSEKVVK